MTQDEIKADVDSAVEEFAQLVEGQVVESTGIRPAPTIEVGETVFDTTPFDFGLDKAPDVAIQGEGGGFFITYPPTGPCCKPAGCFIMTSAECSSEGGLYQGDDLNCTPNPCTCGYYVTDTIEGGPPVYYPNAAITIARYARPIATPGVDYIDLDASWSTSIIATCPYHVAVPGSTPSIFGCQAGTISVGTVSGTFTNALGGPPLLHCTLSSGTGGAVPCLKWGAPDPPGVNCCCNSASVDGGPWYADIYGACGPGTQTEVRHTNSYSLHCYKESGGSAYTYNYDVSLS